MEKFILANGVAFRYSDTEKGEKVILLIHGYLESLECWETITSELAKEYRVIALDVPGHGISEVVGEVHTMEFVAETIAALLVKLEISKSSVIGHSMGGYISLALARLYPDMVEKLVLLHSTPDGDTPIKLENRKREIEVIRSGKKELLATITPGKGFAKENRKRFLETIIDMSEQVMMTEDEGIIALLNGMMERRDENDTFANLGERAMFVFGKGDEFMPEEYCLSLAEKHTNATVLWCENSGHNSHIEETEFFLNGLKLFLAK